MTELTVQGHPGIGPRVEGVALVAKDNFSARYDLDRIKGIFSRPGHALVGQSYVGRILVLNTAKGGVATAWMLGEMASSEPGAEGASVQPRQSYHGAGRRIRGPDFARSFRRRCDAGHPNR